MTPNPHVDERHDEPDRDERLGGEREVRIGPAPEFAEEKEQGEQDHPAADYHRHMHNQPSGNAFYTSAC